MRKKQWISILAAGLMLAQTIAAPAIEETGTTPDDLIEWDGDDQDDTANAQDGLRSDESGLNLETGSGEMFPEGQEPSVAVVTDEFPEPLSEAETEDDWDLLIEEETEQELSLQSLEEQVQTQYVYTDSILAFSRAIGELPSGGMTFAALSANEETSDYVSQRLIVKSDGETVDFSQVAPEVVISGPDQYYIAYYESAQRAEAACEILNRTAHVLFAEPDEVMTAQELGLIEESQNTLLAAAAKSWGASVLGAPEFASFAGTVTNRTITVAVVDSGVMTSHPFLSGRIASGGYNFGDSNQNVADRNGHGTHIAGTIVDCTPGLNVKVLPLKVIDRVGLMYTSYAMLAIDYAVIQGAEVINYSIGLEGEGHSYAIHSAIGRAISNGVTVVVAAGNNGANTADDSCPAHLSEPIIVASIGRNLQRSSFSNYGSSVDVAAPGEDIISCSTSGGYVSMSGTSMAAPHISALAAMVRLVHPTYTPAQVERFLCAHSRDKGAAGKDSYYGSGVPDLGSAYTRLSISQASVTLAQTLVLYTGSALRPAVTVTYMGNTLRENVHYKLSYSNNVRIGTATVTVTGLGYFSGSVSKQFVISTLTVPALVGVYNGAYGIGIKWKVQSAADAYEIWRKYKGVWSRIATVAATDPSLQRSGNTLMYTDQSVKSKYGEGYIYSVAAKQGSFATAYSSAGLAIYRLKPPSITSAVSKNGKVTVKWSYAACHGYQLQYAVKGDTGQWKTAATTGKRSVSVSGLTKGKRYYFRIRCYKTNADRGTTWSEYSPWFGVTVK